jgi:hypothetical protein
MNAGEISLARLKILHRTRLGYQVSHVAAAAKQHSRGRKIRPRLA